MKRFLLVSIQPSELLDEEAFRDLVELRQLVTAYGGRVVDVVVQKREIHDKGMYIGSGKVKEIAGRLNAEAIDVVVLNAQVKPGQLFELLLTFSRARPEIEVWDRIDLILQIFARHAQTAEARLQIELAAMRHMGPRIYGMGSELSRQSGGIGGRGIGETNTELMKRHWQRQMKAVEEKLERLATAREAQMSRRRKLGLATVSLIGYTNAGKTSLFNRLAGKKKRASNALFVTLDSSTGAVWLPEAKRKIIVADTIGFIQRLPAELVEAFRSTLMEALHADVLVQVIDASDVEMAYKIEVVGEVVRDLGLERQRMVYVFNKMDRAVREEVELRQTYDKYWPVCLSAATGDGIDELIGRLEEMVG